MKTKFNVKRKGFTLVELLIVIVVIGVLSAMMMLSSTEAVSSARASNIISNLRNLKTAALSLYVASLDELSKTGTGAPTPTLDHVKRYMNSSENYDGYGISFSSDGSTYDAKSWYVSYGSTSNTIDANVLAKLEARRKSVGLLKEANKSKTGDDDKLTASGVYMLVR